jgi:hypothetical protein
MDDITQAAVKAIEAEATAFARNLEVATRHPLKGHRRTRLFKVLESIQRFNELFDEAEDEEE